MRRMSKIEWINKEDRRVCVQSGITGGDLIELLKEEGFTMVMNQIALSFQP